MARKKSTLSEEQQAKLIELLNFRLADIIDLQLLCRQAYWNVKGPNFMSLRELFDTITVGVEEDANLIAERIKQLGGKAEGSIYAVAERASVDGYRPEIVDGYGPIDMLLKTLTDFGRIVRSASEQATELQDADTATIFIEIARGIDRWLWFVQTSQQTGN